MRNIVVALLIVGSLLASACGSSGSPEVETAAPTPTPARTSTPTPTPEPQPSPTPAEVDSRPLATILDETPDASGWPVPPGRWSTDAFDEPIVFATTTELRLVRESEGAVWFRQPGGAPDDFVVVTRSALINGATMSDPQRPAPRTQAAVTAAIEAGMIIELLDSGTTPTADGSLHWWDVRFRANDDLPGWLCAEGATCYQPTLTTAGERVILRSEQRSRLFMTETPIEPPLGAWTSGGDPIDVLIEIADDLLTDAELAAALPQTEPTTRSLTFAGAEGVRVPGGRSVALVADAWLTLDPATPITGVSLLGADDRSVIFRTSSGYLAFLAMSGLVPGTVDIRPGASYTATDAVLAHPRGTDEFAAFVETELEVLGQGTESLVAGSESTWWDVTIKDPETAYDCPSWPGELCRPLHIGRLGAWAYSGGLENRLYAFGDAGLFLHVEAIDGSVADVLAEGAELLDAMTIEWAGAP